MLCYQLVRDKSIHLAFAHWFYYPVLLILYVQPVAELQVKAAHKALLFKSRESLTTRTLHSELVYNYSGLKHVGVQSWF